MSRSPVLFRCDGTPTHGWEGFYQCLIMATAIQRRRRGTYFLSELSPQVPLVTPIHKGGHEWVEASCPIGSADDLEMTLREAHRLGAVAVLVAAPTLCEEYLRELTASGLLVVTINPLADDYFPNRLVVNPMLGATRDQYQHAKGTQVVTGSRFALVRPMIRRLRPIRAQEPPAPFRAVVALGDDDLTGQTLPLARQLLDMPKVEHVDVIVRPHHPQLDALRAQAADELGRLDVVTETPEISTRLSRAHFAVTSGSGWSLEFTCLGIPQLLTVQADRHIPNAIQLEEEGVAVNLGPAEDVTPAALKTAVQNLLSDKVERQGMARAGRRLIDGRGPDRLVTAVEVLLHVAKPATEQPRLAA